MKIQSGKRQAPGANLKLPPFPLEYHLHRATRCLLMPVNYRFRGQEINAQKPEHPPAVNQSIAGE